MRQGEKRTLFIIAAACILLTASRSASGGEAGPGPGAIPYYRNAALPHPDDLVTFPDDAPTPARADQIVELDELGFGQTAFPMFYGAVPATPGSGAYAGAAPPPAGDEGTASFLGTPAAPVQSAPVTLPGEGFIDYREYARRQEAAAAAAIAPAPPAGGASATLAPVPSSSAIGTVAIRPDPEQSPATVSLDELRAPPPEAVPLPPPPLPELPGAYTLKPELSQVSREFERLRAYCETDDLAGATSVYAAMPNFGEDEALNRIRADSANLLILGFSRTGNLAAARKIYDSLPSRMPGFDANLARARAVINLTTYYVRAERFNDAHTVLMDIGGIQNRSVLNNELFRLMARMIPYLDNAEETEKATGIYDQLLKEVKSPGTAALFADNMRGVVKYYLHFVDNTESPSRRKKRLDFLEHVFDSLEIVSNPDVAALRRDIGAGLIQRYPGNAEKAARFTLE